MDKIKMNRNIVILLALILILTSALGGGCKNENEPVNIVVQSSTPNGDDEQTEDAPGTETLPQDSDPASGPDTPETIEMVSFTIPAYFYENRSYDRVIKEAQDAGYEAYENSDGSVTFIMTQEQHEKLLDDARKYIDGLIYEMIHEEEYWGIADIESNEDYSDIIVFCTENINAFDNISISGVWCLGYYTGLYQIYLGKEEEDAKSVITVIDVSTNKIYTTVISPDEMST